MAPLTIPGFDHLETRRLCLALCKELIEEHRLNEFLERVCPIIGEFFGTSRVSLVDYYEQTDTFDLLYFTGYPPDAVHQLGRRMDRMELRGALRRREPYHSQLDARFYCIPLYFANVLEALVVLEHDAPVEETPARQEAGKILSRLLGLLMSSTRLAVNQKHQLDAADLQRARQIQLSFLPRERPRCAGCDVYGFNQSSALVGGDYFDFFPLEEQRMRCILADACGHGLAAALIMSNFRGLLQARVAGDPGPERLFDGLNQSVHFDEDFIQYLTGVFLDYDGGRGTLHYLNAGHYEPLVIAPDGSSRTLPGGGPPLGMFKNSRYPLGQARLNPGELVVLFTDGLVDIENARGDYFGTEGIAATVRESLHRPLEEISDSVLDRAREFGGDALEDDVTLLMMRVP